MSTQSASASQIADEIEQIAGSTNRGTSQGYARVKELCRQLRALKPNPASPEANAVTCKQCFHYNIKEGHYSMVCLSCKRSRADLFTPRAEAS